MKLAKLFAKLKRRSSFSKIEKKLLESKFERDENSKSKIPRQPGEDHISITNYSESSFKSAATYDQATYDSPLSIPEIFAEICEKLDIPSILQMQLVCKTWNQLANQPVVWKRKCENMNLKIECIKSNGWKNALLSKYANMALYQFLRKKDYSRSIQADELHSLKVDKEISPSMVLGKIGKTQVVVKSLYLEPKEQKENLLYLKKIIRIRDKRLVSQMKVITFKDKEFQNLVCIIMEHVPDGQPLTQRFPSEIETKFQIARQVMNGLSALHHEEMAFGSLNPEKILISSDSNVKLCPQVVSKRKITKVSSAFNSPSEIYGKVHNGDTDCRDVFSYGTLLYYLFTGIIPFVGDDGNSLSAAEIQSQIDSGKRPEIPEDVPPKVREMIETCWKQVGQRGPVRPSHTDLFEMLDTAKNSLL